MSFVSLMVALITGVMNSQNLFICIFLMARLGQIKNIDTEQFKDICWPFIFFLLEIVQTTFLLLSKSLGVLFRADNFCSFFFLL